MPSKPDASASIPCDAISFGWAFDAAPARLGVQIATPATHLPVDQP